MATCFTKKNKIVADTDYSEKNLAKSITGARWKGKKKVWTYPYSPFIAQDIVKRFGTDSVTSEIIELAKKAQKADRADQVRGEENLPQPEARNYDSWTHQLQAYWFAYELHAAGLFMPMGTGKSKVAVDLVQNRDHENVVIVCPKVVIPVWGREFRKHCVVDYELSNPTSGSVNDRLDKMKNTWDTANALGHTGVVVFNYECLLNDNLYDWLKEIDIECMIADECHRIKAPGGKQSRACYRIGKDVPYKLGLTGTPLPHSPMDIYAQYRWLDPGIFGTSFQKFKNKYAVMGGYEGKEVVSYKNEDELHDKIYRIAYRCDEDVIDLPDDQTIRREFELSNEAREHYDNLENKFITFLEEADDAITVDNALVKLLRLQQITSGYLSEDDTEVEVGDGKKKLAKEIIQDIDQNEPVVVFCRFRRDLRVVEEIADDLGRTFGEVSGDRDDLTEDGAMPGDVDILAAQIQSANLGIDLTKSKYAIYYSKSFSLGDYQQSKKRLHRPGQEDDVNYIHLVGEETIDETILEALDSKKEIVDFILKDFDVVLEESDGLT